MSQPSYPIYVAEFFQPDNRPWHWSMWILTDNNVSLGTSINVEGFAGNWTVRVGDCHNPMGSQSIHSLVYIGEFPAWSLPKLINYCKTQLLTNDSAMTWNCRTFITELVMVLEDSGIVEEGIADTLGQRLRQGRILQ